MLNMGRGMRSGKREVTILSKGYAVDLRSDGNESKSENCESLNGTRSGKNLGFELVK